MTIFNVKCKNLFYEFAGSVLVAIGIYNFAVNSNFPLTGFSGIAIILYRLFQLPIGMTTILLNIPVAVICYKLIGRAFFFRSVRCLIISSVMIDVVAPLFPVYQGDRLLSAICTGIIAGFGYAIIYMQNSSTGGSDFIVMAIKAIKPYLTLGKVVFFCDLGIVVVGGLIFKDIDGIIYGLIINYLFAIVVDKIMYGINAGKMTLIVTTRGDEVTKVIEESCGRGCTILNGVGGFQKEEKDIVMCACSNKQMYLVQKAVKELDKNAFIIILESNEVHGEGFSPLIIGEKEEID